MNQDIERGLVVIRSLMLDTQEAFDAHVNQWHRGLGSDHAAERKQLEVENARLRRALYFCYDPIAQEMIDFDDHCNEVYAAGGSPPDEESHWVNRALDRWGGGQNE